MKNIIIGFLTCLCFFSLIATSISRKNEAAIAEHFNNYKFMEECQKNVKQAEKDWGFGSHPYKCSIEGNFMRDNRNYNKLEIIIMSLF